MRNIIALILLTHLTGINVSGQSYTIYKSGINTWGNHYVPPVWGKTYNFNQPAYQPPPRPSNSYNEPVRSGRNGDFSDYVPRERWSYQIDLSAGREAFRKMNKALADAKEVYFEALDSAIKLFNAGAYSESYQKVQNLHQKPFEMINELEDGNRSMALDTLNYWSFQYWPIKYCYQYFCEVKLQQFEEAINTYNGWLSAHRQSASGMNPAEVWPMTGEYYFVFRPDVPKDDFDFNRIILHDRFRADLFLVEALIGMGKQQEAGLFFEKTLEFYSPRFQDLYPYLPQMAINYFFLDKVDESRTCLEHYCNKYQSNAARYAIIGEILQNNRLLEKWAATPSPAGFSLLEDNMLFLDSLQQSIDKSGHPYSTNAWKKLYLELGNHPEKFVQKLAPEIEANLDERVREIHTIKNSLSDNGTGERVKDMNLYMIGLMRSNDQVKIDRVLSKLSAIAEEEKRHALEELPAFQETNLASCKKHGCKGEVYWLEYYRNLASPAERAAFTFLRLSEFSKAGGSTFMQPYLQPYLDDLANYTQEESSACHFCWDELGIKPKFRKSRSYPKKY